MTSRFVYSDGASVSKPSVPLPSTSKVSNPASILNRGNGGRETSLQGNYHSENISVGQCLSYDLSTSHPPTPSYTSRDPPPPFVKAEAFKPRFDDSVAGCMTHNAPPPKLSMTGSKAGELPPWRLPDSSIKTSTDKSKTARIKTSKADKQLMLARVNNMMSELDQVRIERKNLESQLTSLQQPV
uniref:Uncharacterized protein n=1 Tax=Polyblepharides amylifera TaxID=1486889 RepID=A0A7R9SVY2_9CHLO|mmetsp:Transcript_1236/g.1756  ORF Transcript_1236/g.1756 Transcript_1236/m.1756 type:complete len:184 (+) Transcript_1236:61-612(+)|eukprot:CAMPEP_0196581598 /NCGR_PEP_ID=MMETSP1081-20130531/34550_1 /TAXON_ID=36882 /ORGANISM="Pyramimonas amylifera, Strain CCMP720" /LENGTH=183 /DNA_ID=CAMNT_0041901889 /DNA_START=61 /DNA_END=612 /DNA_ORIENTATION=-